MHAPCSLSQYSSHEIKKGLAYLRLIPNTFAKSQAPIYIRSILHCEKSKIMYSYGTSGVLYRSKSKNKVRLEFSSDENAEIRYCCGFILVKILK